MSTGPGSARDLYQRAGVDVAAGYRAVELIRQVAGRAHRPEVVGGIGGFAGLFDLGDGRLLAAGADSVGTKLEIARLLGKLDTVGIDCVAMSANDVACTGAEPLFFLDYVAVEDLVPEQVAELVSGVAEGCRRAGCALLGGEVAEHPQVFSAGGFDLAGFCVGVVRGEDLLGPHRVDPGAALVGLRSSGLHSNGFSLVRQVLLTDASALEADVPELGRTLGEELLEPTTIYVSALLALARSGLALSAAHITGGGWTENLPRALPPGMGARVVPDAWQPPPIFELVARAAKVQPSALFEVLNMGIGLVVVVAPESAGRAVDEARAQGVDAVVVGEVLEGEGIRFG